MAKLVKKGEERLVGSRAAKNPKGDPPGWVISEVYVLTDGKGATDLVEQLAKVLGRGGRSGQEVHATVGLQEGLEEVRPPDPASAIDEAEGRPGLVPESLKDGGLLLPIDQANRQARLPLSRE